MKPIMQTTRVDGLDTLRALAITLVFMYHYTVFVSNTDTFGWFSQVGWVGVDLFFTLSGYLIGNQIFAAMRDQRGFSLARFYQRRLLRTLPAFYVVLALYYLWPGFRGTAPLLPVWKFLTFTQNFLLAPGTAFSHAWSLCVEEQFYMLLPAAALLLARPRRPLAWMWAAVVATLVVGLAVRGVLWVQFVDGNVDGQLNYYKYIYYSSFCRFDELVAGVALALLRNYHSAVWRVLTSRGNLLLALGLGWCAFTFYLLMGGQYSFAMAVWGYPMLGFGFSLLVLAALSADSVLCVTRIPGAHRLAVWAYAIYLTHKPVCMLLAHSLRVRGVEADAWPVVLMLSATSVLVGYLLYRLVEAPFMRLRARVVPDNFVPRAPLSTA